MRVLVTGGAGFMGSTLVRHLLKKGFEVHVLDALTYAGRVENLIEVMEKIAFHLVDLRDFEALYDTLKNVEPDLIFHLAAETHVDRGIKNPYPFLESNVRGTLHLLEVIRRLDLKATFTSTDEVYGDLWGRPPCDEECPLKPSNPYSASKAAADMFTLSYIRTYGVEVNLVRPANNYGPRQYPEKLIPRTILRIMKGKKPLIHGTGKQIRSWLYVEDFAEGITLVGLKGKKGEIYNLPGERELSVLEVVKTILRIMGKDENWVEFTEDRPGQDMRYAMIGEKAKALGWSHKVPFEEGIKRTVEWYLNNEWWWRPLLSIEKI